MSYEFLEKLASIDLPVTVEGDEVQIVCAYYAARLIDAKIGSPVKERNGSIISWSAEVTSLTRAGRRTVESFCQHRSVEAFARKL